MIEVKKSRVPIVATFLASLLVVSCERTADKHQALGMATTLQGVAIELEVHRALFGHYPLATDFEELQHTLSKAHLGFVELGTDPWGGAIRYSSLDEGASYYLASCGPDDHCSAVDSSKISTSDDICIVQGRWIALPSEQISDLGVSAELSTSESEWDLVARVTRKGGPTSWTLELHSIAGMEPLEGDFEWVGDQGRYSVSYSESKSSLELHQRFISNGASSPQIVLSVSTSSRFDGNLADNVHAIRGSSPIEPSLPDQIKKNWSRPQSEKM